MDYQNLSRDDWIFIALAVLLLLGIMVLPWLQQIADVSNVFVARKHTGIASPQGWLCLLAVLVLIAVIAHMLLDRGRPDADVHPLGGGGDGARLLLVLIAAAFLIVWLIVHLGSFSQLQFGFWVSALLLVALVVFAVRAVFVSSDAEEAQASNAESGASG